MLKSVLSIEERRALIITDDQFASQEENVNASINLDKEKNVPQVLIPESTESSQDENNQNSVPTKNDKEINSEISENVINENNISPTIDLTSASQDKNIQNLVPFEVKEIVSAQDTELKEIKFFACPFCPRTYASQKNFLPHAAQAHFQEKLEKDLPQSEPFDCPICSKNMKKQKSLLLHYAIQHDIVIKLLNENIEEGKGIISNKVPVSTHDTEMKPEETICFSCSFCPKTFTTQQNIVQHATNVHFQDELKKDLPNSEPFECPICSANKKSLASLVLHYAIKHDMAIKLLNEKDETTIKGKKVLKQIQYTCHLCPNKYFGFGKKKLIRHVTHDHYFEKLSEELPAGMDQYKCPKCTNVCKDIKDYAVHYGIVHKMVKTYMKELGFKENVIKTW